jgi:hypothetical protein
MGDCGVYYLYLASRDLRNIRIENVPGLVKLQRPCSLEEGRVKCASLRGVDALMAQPQAAPPCVNMLLHDCPHVDQRSSAVIPTIPY